MSDLLRLLRIFIKPAQNSGLDSNSLESVGGKSLREDVMMTLSTTVISIATENARVEAWTELL